MHHLVGLEKLIQNITTFPEKDEFELGNLPISATPKPVPLRKT